MGMIDSILSAATGGLAGQVVDLVKAYFPPDMAPEKKAEMQIELERIALDRERAALAAGAEAEKAINDRVALYEGTASDLKSIPVLGAIMLFLRGAQRPLIGYATMWMDFNVFSGAWAVTDPVQSNAFWVINFLVLGFLFGERALKNVAPLLAEVMAAKGAK